MAVTVDLLGDRKTADRRRYKIRTSTILSRKKRLLRANMLYEEILLTNRDGPSRNKGVPESPVGCS
jgi:hypothetical protein